MIKSGFDLERGNKEENEHIPIEKLKKVTNYEVQEMFKETNNLEQEVITDNVEVLKDNDVFTDDIINSFKVGAIERWMMELKNRVIQDNMDIIRGCKKMHTIDEMDALDEVVYNDIDNIKHELMKDTLIRKSLFSQIIEALDNNELELASQLQLVMKAKMELLQREYIQYKKNIF